jgi:hypothetical protein
MSKTISVILSPADEGAEHLNCEASISTDGEIEVAYYHVQIGEVIDNAHTETQDPVIGFLRQRAMASGAATFDDLKAAAEAGSFEIQ